MGDDAKNLEMQRLKLIMSLSTVAEALRNCANIAENFAEIIQGTHGGSPGTEPNGAASGKGRKRKAGEDDEPAKRTRKPKDPNAPKRPASSYIMYQNEIRKELREKHPGVTNADLLQIIAKQWAEMSDADKAVYNNAVASAKEQYSQEKKAYDSRSPEEVEAANAATAAALAAKKATPRTRAPKATAAPPAAPAHKAPTSDVTSDEEEEDVSDEDDSVGNRKEAIEKKVKDLSDTESDVSLSSSEEGDEDPEPAPKKAKTKVVASAAPAPKEKAKRKKGGKA